MSTSKKKRSRNPPGLIFPAGRFRSFLKKGTPGIGANYRVSKGAGVYAAALAEAIAFEIVDFAVTKKPKDRYRLSRRDILLGVKGDEDLMQMFKGSIPGAGAVVQIHGPLLQKGSVEHRKYLGKAPKKKASTSKGKRKTQKKGPGKAPRPTGGKAPRPAEQRANLIASNKRPPSSSTKKPTSTKKKKKKPTASQKAAGLR
jgi:hypothetical protein